jgi:hypothetical protein
MYVHRENMYVHREKKKKILFFGCAAIEASYYLHTTTRPWHQERRLITDPELVFIRTFFS